MNTKRTYPKMLILTVAAMIILGALALLVVNQANISRSRLPVYGAVPEFEFTEGNGGLFGLEQMKGKINIVNFIFTRCQGPCPIMTMNMLDLYHLYEHSDKVQFVSITVDPEHDTPEVLKAYAESHGVTDNRWKFLHSSVEDVVELCEGGFMLAADNLPGGHTTKFILVDHLGRIRSYYEGIDDYHMKLLKENVKQLARELP